MIRHYKDVHGEWRQVVFLEHGPLGPRYVLDGKDIVTIPDLIQKNDGSWFDVWKDVEKYDSRF